MELSYKDPEVVPPIKNNLAMVEFLNSIEDKLVPYRGCKGVPLSYLIRDSVEPVQEAADPRTNYGTVLEEMVKRAPHVKVVGDTPVSCLSYNTDNQRLATLLCQMTETNTTDQTWSVGKKRDGRGIVEA